MKKKNYSVHLLRQMHGMLRLPPTRVCTYWYNQTPIAIRNRDGAMQQGMPSHTCSKFSITPQRLHSRSLLARNHETKPVCNCLTACRLPSALPVSILPIWQNVKYHAGCKITFQSVYNFPRRFSNYLSFPKAYNIYTFTSLQPRNPAKRTPRKTSS